MARYGVVQLDLQRVLGLSQTAVSKRLRGLTPWDINELSAVAEFFRMPLGELIASADEPHPSGPNALPHKLKPSRNRGTAQYLDLPIDLNAHRLRRIARLSTRHRVPAYVVNLPRRAA
jgi:transcriptional regulator with XRE-family HTH domain